MHHYTAIAEISRLIVNTAQDRQRCFPSLAMEDMIWHPKREEKGDENAAEFCQTGV